MQHLDEVYLSVNADVTHTISQIRKCISGGVISRAQVRCASTNPGRKAWLSGDDTPAYAQALLKIGVTSRYNVIAGNEVPATLLSYQSQ